MTETSSAFPNTETFHRREEFCLLAKKLVRTCATKKALALGRTDSLVDFACFGFEMSAYYSIKFHCQLTNLSSLVSSNWTNEIPSPQADHYPHLCSHLAEIEDPDRTICSAGFWDPSSDHPNLLRPLTEEEKSAFNFRDFQTSPNPKTLSDLGWKLFSALVVN